jgi:spermidine/putrescine transport system substrate-binding protein
MKRFALLLLMCFCLMGICAEEHREQVLKVSNWVDYIDEKLITEFEQWYQQTTGEKIRVEYDTYVMPDTMYYKVANRHMDYDVCCPPEYLVERMFRHKLLLAVDTAVFQTTGTPNWLNGTSRYLDDALEVYDEYEEARLKDYAVPYQWGTTGVVFNPFYVSRQDVESWDFLFDPKFKSTIRVKDAFSDLSTILIIYANREDIDSGRVSRALVAGNQTEESLEIVRQMLKRIRPQLAGWEFDEGRQRMSSGDDWVAVTWNGEAQWAINHARNDVSLEFVVPREGSVLWIDCWVIPAYARNVKAASYWINFMSRPDNALRCAATTNWTSAIATAEVLKTVSDTTFRPIDLRYFFGPKAKAVHVNPVLYPESSTVDRLALMRDVADRQEMIRQIWDEMKAEKPSYTMQYVGIALAVVVIAIVLLIVIRYVRRKRDFEKE